MAPTAQGTQAPDPQAWLAACVRRGLSALSASIDGPPTEEVRSRLYYLLRLALDMPDVWPSVVQGLDIWLPRLSRALDDPSWPHLLEALHARAHVLGDPITQARISLYLGTFYRVQDRYEEAEAAFRRAEEIFAAHGDLWRLAQAKARHAVLAYHSRDFARMQRLLAEIAALPLDPEDETPSALDARAYLALLQGILAFERKGWDRAAADTERAYHLWCRAGEYHMAGVARSDQALFLHWSGRDLEQARALYQEALALLEQAGARSDWAVAQMGLGSLLRQVGDVRGCLACYHRAEPVLRLVRNHTMLARLYNNIGRVYAGQGRWAEAEQAYRLGLEAWAHTSNAASRIRTLINLVEALLAQGKEDEARDLAALVEARLAALEGDPAQAELRALWEDVWTDGPAPGGE